MRPDVFKRSASLDLQPLRIPAGWMVAWNTLYASSRGDRGEFGGSSLFHAINHGRRFAIDVTFEPEFDPTGSFHLNVIYQPWSRTDRGRRRTDAPFAFDANAQNVHAFETASLTDLVQELETWLGRCTT